MVHVAFSNTYSKKSFVWHQKKSFFAWAGNTISRFPASTNLVCACGLSGLLINAINEYSVIQFEANG